jgi:hypothetical protein
MDKANLSIHRMQRNRLAFTGHIQIVSGVELPHSRGNLPMKKDQPYYSAKEPAKSDRVYHIHNDCPSGRDIIDKRKGQPAGYKLCLNCKRMG